MRNLNRSLGAGATLVAAVAVSGCGSSSEETSPADWANGLCSAITSYTNALKDAGTTLKEGGISKSALQDTADTVKGATQTFTSSVEDLGTPNTSAGGAAKQTVDNLSSDLQDDVSAITEATSGSSSTLNAVSSVSSALANAQSQITSAIDDVRALDAKSEFHQAFAQAPACSSVPGLSS